MSLQVEAERVAAGDRRADVTITVAPRSRRAGGEGAEAVALHVAPIPEELRSTFEIGDVFAAGSTGVLFRATERARSREGILKVVGLAGQTIAESPRVRRELGKQTTLAEPSLVTAWLVGETPTATWVFRPLVEGESVAERLARGPLSVAEAAAIGTRLAVALDELHRAGLLHRDVRTGHVIIPTAGVGHAMLIDAGLPSPTAGYRGLGGYASAVPPEQAGGKLTSFRSDLYSLGCVLYEMLEGNPPFGGSIDAQLHGHQEKSAPALARGVPSTLASLVTSLLAKDPKERPFSAQQVKRTLETFVEGPKRTTSLASLDTLLGAGASSDAAPTITQPAATMTPPAPPSFDEMPTVPRTDAVTDDGARAAIEAFPTQPPPSTVSAAASAPSPRTTIVAGMAGPTPAPATSTPMFPLPSTQTAKNLGADESELEEVSAELIVGPDEAKKAPIAPPVPRPSLAPPAPLMMASADPTPAHSLAPTPVELEAPTLTMETSSTAAASTRRDGTEEISVVTPIDELLASGEATLDPNSVVARLPSLASLAEITDGERTAVAATPFFGGGELDDQAATAVGRIEKIDLLREPIDDDLIAPYPAPVAPDTYVSPLGLAPAPAMPAAQNAPLPGAPTWMGAAARVSGDGPPNVTPIYPPHEPTLDGWPAPVSQSGAQTQNAFYALPATNVTGMPTMAPPAFPAPPLASGSFASSSGGLPAPGAQWPSIAPAQDVAVRAAAPKRPRRTWIFLSAIGAGSLFAIGFAVVTIVPKFMPGLIGDATQAGIAPTGQDHAATRGTSTPTSEQEHAIAAAINEALAAANEPSKTGTSAYQPEPAPMPAPLPPAANVAAAEQVAAPVEGLAAAAAVAPAQPTQREATAQPAATRPASVAAVPEVPAPARAEPTEATPTPAIAETRNEPASSESRRERRQERRAERERATQPTATATPATPAPLPSAPSPAGNFDTVRAEARNHFSAGRFREAAAAYERATAMNASHAGSFAGLGAARLALGDSRGAVNAYLRAVSLSPSTSGFQSALGRAYLASGDRTRARAALERALALDPSNAAARATLEQL